MAVVDDRAHLAQVVFRIQYTTLPEDARRELADAIAGNQLGIVRLDETLTLNLGVGGPGGIPILADVYLNVAEGAASGLLTVAIVQALKPAFGALRHRLFRWTTKVVRKDGPTVTYAVQADSANADQSFDVMPADYERVVTSEFRVWRDGRWQRHESIHVVERGRDSAPPSDTPV